MKKYLLLIFSIALFSCSNSNNPEDTSNSGDIAYFRASINGKSIDFTENNTINSVYSQNFVYSGCFLNGQDCVIDYGAFLLLNSAGSFTPSIGLSFDNLYNQTSQANESSTFYDLFNTIPGNFITSVQEANDIKGVDVQYTSVDDKTYSTLGGSQIGSTISILSSTKGLDGESLKIQTIVGNINCKLYNGDNPLDILTLTNGKFKLIFREKAYN